MVLTLDGWLDTLSSGCPGPHGLVDGDQPEVLIKFPFV